MAEEDLKEYRAQTPIAKVAPRAKTTDLPAGDTKGQTPPPKVTPPKK